MREIREKWEQGLALAAGVGSINKVVVNEYSDGFYSVRQVKG